MSDVDGADSMKVAVEDPRIMSAAACAGAPIVALINTADEE